MLRGRRRILLLLILFFGSGFFLVRWLLSNHLIANSYANFEYISRENFNNITQQSAFIFVGGVPRSGTTLMRAMLDAHPSIRCGEETRVIPRVLSLRAQWKKSAKEWRRLEEAGVTDRVINNAISAFIINVIVGHGVPAEKLCNKDPFVLKYTEYLSNLFPNSKFLLMIRDGRATVNSIISRKVTITGFDLKDPRQCLEKWNGAISLMSEQCIWVGSSRCLMVYYEQLVLHPRREMQRVLDFLNIIWDESVLHHEQFIGKVISLSKVERSSDQVVKPIYLDALTSWFGKFPKDVLKDMNSIAPMLKQLGYDPVASAPKYGDPDPEILQNMDRLRKEKDKWDLAAKKAVLELI